MKTQILKSIFLFCTLNFLFCIYSNAQIVYTDVIPDVTVNTNGGIYHLDLNNDGINDFDITSSTSIAIGNCGPPPTNIFKRVTTLNSNEVGAYGLPLQQNTSIDSSTFWSTYSNQILAAKTWHCVGGGGWPHWVPTIVGGWPGVSNKYLSLRLHVGAQTYYGWVRLDVGSSISLTVKDYAYNAIPNQFILAGDTGATTTGIIHNSAQSTNHFIYPNPATNSISIKFPSHEAGEISILNLFGQVVFSEKINAEQKQIDVSKFTAGMYVVKWNNGENYETKTFSVIK